VWSFKVDCSSGLTAPQPSPDDSLVYASCGAGSAEVWLNATSGEQVSPNWSCTNQDLFTVFDDAPLSDPSGFLLYTKDVREYGW
jgi:hypothetical protein